jgi:hypothetical protein
LVVLAAGEGNLPLVEPDGAKLKAIADPESV